MGYSAKENEEGADCTMTLPFLTSTLPGIGGQMRTLPEDFQVEERPLYLPCGEGDHLYVSIRKRLLSTPDLVLRRSSVLGATARVELSRCATARAERTEFPDRSRITDESCSSKQAEPVQAHVVPQCLSIALL